MYSAWILISLSNFLVALADGIKAMEVDVILPEYDINIIENANISHAALAAPNVPFKIKGRRPSDGCKRMPKIIEE